MISDFRETETERESEREKQRQRKSIEIKHFICFIAGNRTTFQLDSLHYLTNGFSNRENFTLPATGADNIGSTD